MVDEIVPCKQKIMHFVMVCTVYVKDCGLFDQNIHMIILFLWLIAWLDFSPGEIQKN